MIYVFRNGNTFLSTPKEDLEKMIAREKMPLFNFSNKKDEATTFTEQECSKVIQLINNKNMTSTANIKVIKELF